jgi:hypothetical protein
VQPVGFRSNPPWPGIDAPAPVDIVDRKKKVVMTARAADLAKPVEVVSRRAQHEHGQPAKSLTAGDLAILEIDGAQLSVEITEVEDDPTPCTSSPLTTEPTPREDISARCSCGWVSDSLWSRRRAAEAGRGHQRSPCREVTLECLADSAPGLRFVERVDRDIAGSDGPPAGRGHETRQVEACASGEWAQSTS